MPILFGNPQLQNILRGKIPVASGWGTNPPNLENSTDGDALTGTGPGSTVMGAVGNYGYLTWDLGTAKKVMVSARMGQWSSAGGVNAYWSSSDDNITFRDLTTAGGVGVRSGITSVAEVILEGYAAILTGRYIRIRCHVSGAATAYAKFYEVVAYEMN